MESVKAHETVVKGSLIEAWGTIRPSGDIHICESKQEAEAQVVLDNIRYTNIGPFRVIHLREVG